MKTNIFMNVFFARECLDPAVFFFGAFNLDGIRYSDP